jgi:Ni2+-binding GTPase involved in maturation of urease and hydrogenase
VDLSWIITHAVRRNIILLCTREVTIVRAVRVVIIENNSGVEIPTKMQQEQMREFVNISKLNE